MSVVSGIMGAKAAEDAADAQAAAADRATNSQMEMFNKSNELIEPWRAAGVQSLNALMGGTTYSKEKPDKEDFYTEEILSSGTPPTDMYGGGKYYASARDIYEMDQAIQADPYWSQVVSPIGQPTNAITTSKKFNQSAYDKAMDAYLASGTTTKGLIPSGPGEFTKSPGYDFRLSEGQKAIERSAAARGGVLNGANEKAIVRYGQDYATNDYDNFLRRYYDSLNPYLTVAGMGQTSAGQASTNALNTGTNISNAQLASGNAQAGGYINRANAISGSLKATANNALNLYDYWKNNQSAPGVPATPAVAIAATPAAYDYAADYLYAL